MASTPAAKDRITCHVLDTVSGRPAKALRVKLELVPSGPEHTHGQSTKVFESQTDDDGRIKTWLPYSESNASGEVPVYTLEDVLANVEGTTRWALRFDSGGYFGEDETLFPEVYVVFKVEQGQHYHVPLLLSPYSYTTYRGS